MFFVHVVKFKDIQMHRPKLALPWPKDTRVGAAAFSKMLDSFSSYTQPKLDTPKNLTHFQYFFAMFLIWIADAFWSYSQPKLDTNHYFTTLTQI